VPHVRVTDTDPAIDLKPRGKKRIADLLQIVQEARDLAASGGGTVPPDVGPLEADLTARRQFSVSRLSGKLIRPDARELEWLSSAEPEAIDPLVFGTYVHAALARIDLCGKLPIGKLCEQLASERVIHNAAGSAELATELLERFAASSRWAQIAAAKTIHRELEFLLTWPPGGSLPLDGSAEEGRYLQGFFDCLYADESGRWHLVDYKTNDVTIAQVPAEAQRYEMQMLLYALAFEQATGQSPAELVLHFLRPGIECSFVWNDTARKRCVELVSDAIREFSTSDA
jgi:hypothetical protein